MNNIFIYWLGYDYKLIKILRSLMIIHFKNKYNLHIINQKNIHEYIPILPKIFYKLKKAHQSDFIRYNVIYKYGGIWLDSDTIIINNLDSLFRIIKDKDGFFIMENNNHLCGGVFGSKPKTKILKKLVDKTNIIFDEMGKNFPWSFIGPSLLQYLYLFEKNLFKNYHIFQGLDTMYPVNWDICPENFLFKKYDNYKKLKRKYQPLVVIVNKVYKCIDHFTYEDILYNKMPINYFLNKSIVNMNLDDIQKSKINYRIKNCIINIKNNKYKIKKKTLKRCPILKKH